MGANDILVSKLNACKLYNGCKFCTWNNYY